MTGARAAKLQSDIALSENEKDADAALQEANKGALDLEEAAEAEQKSGLDDLQQKSSEGRMELVDVKADLASAETHAEEDLSAKIRVERFDQRPIE